MPSVGQKFGRYRIEEEIGAGGMGVVYRAYDEKLERDLAIKMLTADHFPQLHEAVHPVRRNMVLHAAIPTEQCSWQSFPGSPVELDHIFKLPNNKIASLEIRS